MGCQTNQMGQERPEYENHGDCGSSEFRQLACESSADADSRLYANGNVDIRDLYKEYPNWIIDIEREQPSSSV